MTVLGECIECVECAYESMLAYAAQGKESDLNGDVSNEAASDSAPSEIRTTLSGLRKAVAQIQAELASSPHAFAKVVIVDIDKAGAALDLVLHQTTLGSELVDNLNASIHLRAVLTDLFLIDETHE